MAINYRITMRYDENIPNNNYSDEVFTILTDSDDYDLADYLSDNGVAYERDGDEFIVLDDFFEPTGERYLSICND